MTQRAPKGVAPFVQVSVSPAGSTVDATLVWSLLAGVWKPKVLLALTYRVH